MNQINKHFVKFLKHNHALKQYIKNLRKLRKCHFQTWENYTNPFTTVLLRKCLDGKLENNLIDRAFLWTATPEGQEFWLDLDMKWRNWCCQNHNFLNI